MLRRLIISLLTLGLFLLSEGCLDPYQAPTSQVDVGYLVVDGFLNASDGTCKVTLARTLTIESYKNPTVEGGADVRLVDEGGATHPLVEAPLGTYTVSNLTLGEGDQVKLKITTKGKADYESTLMPVLVSAPIDSVTSDSERPGLIIQVSAHNTNSNKYFYWKYSETWFHTAAYSTSLTLNAQKKLVPLTENIFSCWTTLSSTDILVFTSSNREDGTGVVSKFPLTTILWESPKVKSQYSIEVEQRAITKEMFEYLEQLKKNTENLGTLFDPLPSSPQGNIRNITHPDEPVLGSFFASTVQKKRIFLSVLDWNRPPGTSSETGNEACFLAEIRSESDWNFFWPVSSGLNGPILGTTKNCVDCRLNGGTNVRPDFWIW